LISLIRLFALALPTKKPAPGWLTRAGFFLKFSVLPVGPQAFADLK
jgi:hypothetical protein